MTDWDEFEEYGWFAEIYGWTPAQVDDLPWWLRVRYRHYHNLVVEYKRQEMEQQ